MDGIGATHSGKTTKYDVLLSNKPIQMERIPVVHSKEADIAFKEFYLSLYSWKHRVKLAIKKMFFIS